MKHITLKQLNNGNEVPQIITEQRGKKQFKIKLERIKLCSLNNNAREIIFVNEFELKQNRFEDMAEKIVKQVRALKYKYTLYDWKQNKITFLVSPEQLKNTVREDTYYSMKPLSNKAIKEMQLSEMLPI